MGFKLGNHDIYVDNILSLLNLRFAPSLMKLDPPTGGIEELAALQKEFGIFKKGRPLYKSIQALNLAPHNLDLQSRVLDYFRDLGNHPSSEAGANGEEAILQAIIRDLESPTPLPIHFTSHAMTNRSPADNPVKLAGKGRPLHYMDADYLVISLPLRARPAGSAAAGSNKDPVL
ncbi:hypothetical protein [Ottowia sp.]|uniref:hypothetical protein n=1 Tax=Ottowia sp. TaxID=1898956 RepID=UPI001D6D9B55|nr:hypothetical protein [Ottowia sp.]MCP5256546.1 hypothetical protein [Burkholderiaceae bacterium]MCB2024678.1 hypothetical protein [Ottowia sp.]MCB2034148.1 hypothetical protein [Ottowia sp.]MCB2036487.1 hypothetical protein [Ottowia sp.]HPK31741.1 hypothetical protein [Ottowia sp.]